MSDKKEISLDWKKALKAETQEVMVKEPEFDGIQTISLRHGRMSLNDKELPNSELQCIIIGSILERTWYDRPFDADDKAPPNCFALGHVMSELKPHENVPAAPSPQCKGCPLAEFGTAMQGKGPACKTRMKLLVVPAPDNIKPEALVDPEMAFIKVSPTSVVNFNGLGTGGKAPGYEKTLALKGLAPWGAITKVMNKPHPKKMAEVTFEFVKSNIADEPLMAASYALAAKAEVELNAAFEYDEEDAKDEKPATKARY
jgi:hypothetical protein